MKFWYLWNVLAFHGVPQQYFVHIYIWIEVCMASGFLSWLKRNCQNVCSPLGPASEGGGCLQIPWSNNSLSGRGPWLPNERNRDGISHHQSEGNLGETFAHTTVAMDNLDDVTPYLPGILTKELCWCLLLPQATRLACCFIPGNFNRQIQAAFWELLLQVVADPRTDHQPVTLAS